MANFGHGGNAKIISRNRDLEYDKIIDFSANINPIGLNENVKEEIIKNINLIEKYPDISYFELKNAITGFENENLIEESMKIKNDNLILGNGAAEVLFSIARGINPKNTLILAPTFSEYEECINSINGNVNLYYLKEEHDFEIKEDILDYINEELDLIFICNPNNPTGTITKREMIINILDKAKKYNTFVVIDESFLDFIKEDFSMMKYINIYDNLIIVKSLTKVFAMPGIRIGYGVCSNYEIVRAINKTVPAWNINILAEVATITALKDKTYLNKSRNYVLKEKDYLYNHLSEEKDIKVFYPSVNFIFFKLNKDIDLQEELLNKNILIRSCSNYNGLDKNYYRIAVRTHEENVSFLNSLKEVLK